MTASQLQEEAPRLKLGEQAGRFRSGNSFYELHWDSHPDGEPVEEGVDILLVTDTNSRLRAVIALKDVETGEPLVDIIQIGDSVDKHPLMLRKIMDRTYDATRARRLRLGHESNVSHAGLLALFGQDRDDSTTLVFPRNVSMAA